MKILTTETGKIISFGEFAYATGTNTVIDVSEEETTIPVIKQLAEINGCHITAKKKADMISQLSGYLAENYKEETEMSEAEKYEGIVVAGFEAEKTDNDIKRELFEAGCDFADINKTFNSIVQEKGLRLSTKDRNEKAAEFLEGYEPTDVESHLAKLSALEDHLGVKSTQAGAAMRAWAKSNDIELPKAPRAPKAAPGYRGNIKVVADHALANKDVTFDELVAFAAENVEKTKGGKDNSRGYAVQVWNAIIFAKSWAGEDASEMETEVEEDEVA